jgi:hypothetical protein
MEAAGNHSELTDYLKELKNTEDSLVKFYSDALGLDNTTIHSLLKSETYLNATQAKDLGQQCYKYHKKQLRLQNNEIKEENLMNKLNRKLIAL